MKSVGLEGLSTTSMGRTGVGKQANQQEYPAINQGVQTVLPKYIIAFFLLPSNETFILDPNPYDRRLSGSSLFFLVLLKHLLIYNHIPPNVLNSL